eukprot:TRINITY_DN18723_c0_g1_i5.p1 TRINITY_DN18723_c0_g1~~TRINITY_DN18723_c0_g1_i5.p1  ORF type:complete len:381 (+),score=103.34 TRINITY_DN18723_c0_g1_i5:132-1274(+)
MRSFLILLSAAAAHGGDLKVEVTTGGMTSAVTGMPAAVGQTYGSAGVITELPDFLQGSTYFPIAPFAQGGELVLTCPGTASSRSGTTLGKPANTPGGGSTNSPSTSSPSGGSCETAFARSPNAHTCFDEFGFSRWGWTNIISGSTSIPVYSAAGQCDINKGWLSAYLNVEYLVGQGIRLTYVPLSGQTIQEIHMYVGKDPLPMKNGAQTVAPGQYPAVFEDGRLTYTFLIPGLKADEQFYLVAHAKICGPKPESPKPAPDGDCPCTFYITALKCAPCSVGINGGFEAELASSGWETRSCGPKFNIEGGSGFKFGTVVFKKEIDPGMTEIITASTDAMLVGVFAATCEDAVEWCPMPPPTHIFPMQPVVCPCGELPEPMSP